MDMFFRDKIKLKAGVTKKQGDVALLLAHNQGTGHIHVAIPKELCLQDVDAFRSKLPQI